MQWTDEVRIETPEQIDVALEVAGLGSRFFAQAIDWALKVVLILSVVIVIAFAGTMADVRIDEPALQKTAGAIAGVVIFAFMFGFDIFFEVYWNGQTPGKKVAGIRVIKEGGAAIDFSAAAVRNLLGLADFLPVFYMLGSLVILLNQRGQRLGDMAAGTLVVRERSAEIPDITANLAQDLAVDAIAFSSQQLHACTPDDRHILKSYFQRAAGMDPIAREQLAATLAQRYRQKTAYTPDAEAARELTAEAFLASLYRDLEANARHSG